MPQRVKEEERIERIIRDLLKLPENRRCINCNSLGPQYVCTTLWTFVCTNCSGVHREFTHRVKSVSMAKFNAAEVCALQDGGNERARQIYFKVWDSHRNSFPDASNIHRIRDFIKHVYLDRKYTGENSSLPMVRTKLKCDNYEKHSSERAKSVGGDDFYERRSFEKISPSVRNNEKTLRFFMEQRSPRYTPGNKRSGSHRGRSSTCFEIVDDRYRDDGSVRCFDRYSGKESRAGKMSPDSQGIRETNSPETRLVKDILRKKVLSLRIGEPPKDNDGRDAEGSARDRKTSDPTNLHFENKEPKENETVDSSSLIHFDANPVSPTKAEVQAQQTASSAPSPEAEKVSNAPNVNSLELLLFELSAPVALPVGSTPQIPTSAEALSGAPQGNITTATNGRGLVPSAPSEEPSQASSKPTQDTGLGDGSKSIGRKELPVDLFTLNHMTLASAVPSWQVRLPRRMGYSMQIYPAAMSTDRLTDSAKPRNPFDLGDERPQIQCPSMESLHGALPNMPSPAGLQPHPLTSHASALAPQVSPYGMSIPPGAYMGQQSFGNPRIIRPQEISHNFGSGEDALAALNPIQKSNGRDSSPFSSIGGNPFG